MADPTPAGAPEKPVPQNMRNYHAKALSALLHRRPISRKNT